MDENSHRHKQRERERKRIVRCKAHHVHNEYDHMNRQYCIWIKCIIYSWAHTELCYHRQHGVCCVCVCVCVWASPGWVAVVLIHSTGGTFFSDTKSFRSSRSRINYSVYSTVKRLRIMCRCGLLWITAGARIIMNYNFDRRPVTNFS